MKNAKHLPQLDRGDQRPISDVQLRAQSRDVHSSGVHKDVYMVRSDGFINEIFRGRITFVGKDAQLIYTRYKCIQVQPMIGFQAIDADQKLSLGYDLIFDDVDDFGRYKVELRLYDDIRKAQQYMRNAMLKFIVP